MSRSTPDPARLFAVLGEEQRLRLWRLIGRQELSVSEITAVLGLPQSTVSRHLKTLRDAGLVSDRRVGTAVYYQHASIAGGSLLEQLGEWARQDDLPTTEQRRLTDILLARQTGSKAFFDQLADQWDTLRRQHFGDSFAFEALVSLLPRDWTVADLGCGTGYLMPTLARQFARVIAVDPAASMLERARQRAAPHGLKNIDFRPGSLEELPLNNAELDAAIVSLVLHHSNEPAAAVQELARVIRPGGQVVVIELRDHQDQAFTEVMGDRWNGFTEKQLSDWLTQAGFTHIRATPLQPPPTGAAAAGLHSLTATRAKP